MTNHVYVIVCTYVFIHIYIYMHLYIQAYIGLCTNTTADVDTDVHLLVTSQRGRCRQYTKFQIYDYGSKMAC